MARGFPTCPLPWIPVRPEKIHFKNFIKILLVKEIILFSFKAVMQNQNRITMMISLSFLNFWPYLGSELAFEGTAVFELLEEF